MVDRFEFLRDFNIEIFQNCRKAEFMVNTMNDCNLSLNAARTALELLCAEENPDYYQYDSLDEKVRSFISRTSPDDNICNALKIIKINGNEGSHGNGSIRKAKDSIDLLAQVLIWYVCGYRGKKYKEVDFHPSELRYAYLYCQDLKTISAKPEKAVTNKKVAVEVKNDAVQQDTAPNPANESNQPENASVFNAAPVEVNFPVIDKEEKKRLKLERKAQEEAERKAKRNAERELRKQLQKEQKAKALEEAKRRNEEAVAKANAKLQAQEDKKLAKEKELEQKRIRDEQRAVRQEKKRITKYMEELCKEDAFCKEFKKEKKNLYYQQQKWFSEEGIKASMMAWEKQQQEKEYIEKCINNGTDFVLDLLIKATLKKDISLFAIFNKYRDRVPEEMRSLEAKYLNEVNEIYRINESYDFESVSYDKLLNLTRICSEYTFKMSIKKLVLCSIIGYNLINNDHKDIFDSLYSLFMDIDRGRNAFCEFYNYLHTDDAEKCFSKLQLGCFCLGLIGVQKEIEEQFDRLRIKADSYIDFVID